MSTFGPRPAANAGHHVTFQGGHAWRARDERAGRFVVHVYHQPHFELAVCDDFGQLQRVPSYSVLGATVLPAACFPEGTH